jgi:hypothetical protein
VEDALVIIGRILKGVHILCGSSTIMPLDGFETTLSDSIEAYRALVPTTVLSRLQVVKDARELGSRPKIVLRVSIPIHIKGLKHMA